MVDFKIGYHTICWGGVVGDPVGVTSVKDLTYRSYGDIEHAVTDIADVGGYDGCVLFDGNLLDYADDVSRFRKLLETTEVELLAVYSGGNFIYPEILPEELWRIERAARLAGELGSRHLVVGGGAQRADGARDDDYDRLADALDRVVDIAETNGLDAVYHPHLTTIVESPEQVARVLSLSRIGLCADTAHLAAGGGDPAEMLRTHHDRLRYVHLKDLRRDPFGFHPLGEGELDLPGIVQTLIDLEYDGWATVELDSFDGDPREAAATSRRLLARELGDR